MHRDTHMLREMYVPKEESKEEREREKTICFFFFPSLMFLRERIRSDNSISSPGANAIGMVQPSAYYLLMYLPNYPLNCYQCNFNILIAAPPCSHAIVAKFIIKFCECI